jgi:hypothetical protein
MASLNPKLKKVWLSHSKHHTFFGFRIFYAYLLNYQNSV